ncbi:ABC transporter permease [Rathayibacter rathayi]|uniref:ABC transporter permease n=1 Tax=Rathayibacter rathayi TaxID=33887 RepID=UPI000CE81541|nr:ABC transporter permease [Rathayibacter rathayi]PPG70551.1 ABC transporter permease [Rathayibacter rathayi]PPG76718.1 ABC transporter permease [Rathayibacter rathayi]PPH25228.1 ABC transporter permease [Rathayibacter rathayi]PPI77700.1 ABC transporter permease [Rathayibacter rathayi]
MTALTAAPSRHSTVAGRLGSIVRLHFANPATILYTPLAILIVIFLGNLAVRWLILRNLDTAAAVTEATNGMQYSGATFFIFVYMMVVAVQAVNISFGLALGYGSTRRDFSLGTALTFVGLSISWTVLFAVMGGLEDATDGWGFGGNFFRAIYFGDGPLLERVFAVLCTFLFFFFVGSATASVYVRWRQRGMLVFFAALGILVLGVVALLTFTEGWETFGEFFAGLGFIGGYALSLIPTALAALAGWAILRRATPRSS